MAWPPKHCKDVEKQYKIWDAWYSGDPDRLHDIYQVTNGLGGLIDPKGYGNVTDTNLMDRVARYFWGNPPQPGEIRHTKLHVPLAGDISATSADLLFGEPPTFSVDEDESNLNTAEYLEHMVDNGLVPVLSEGAEIGSALGGYYIRVMWDLAVADCPIYDALPPDSAVPHWRSDRLVGVTFWRVVHEEKGNVWRHLEKHEPGRVWHALYKGDNESLGQRCALQEHPETEAFAALVNQDGWVETGTAWLTAEYVPNMKPNRLFRGSPLGRSDYSGIEPTMDAIDETWSSLMRDVRNGKGRVIVPDAYLDVQGPGRGARFDPERGFFSPVKALPDSEGVSLEIVQFDIRVEEHVNTIKALSAQAVRGAGYSAQTFGEMDTVGSSAATATEIQSREKRSYTTRDKKIGYTKPPLGRILLAGLQMYQAKWGLTDIVPQVPNIVFPDGVQTDEFTTARTIQMLDSAGAISLRSKVMRANPQWDKEQVETEMDEIEGGAAPDEIPADDLGPGADRFEDDPAPIDGGALEVPTAEPVVAGPQQAGVA